VGADNDLALTQLRSHSRQQFPLPINVKGEFRLIDQDHISASAKVSSSEQHTDDLPFSRGQCTQRSRRTIVELHQNLPAWRGRTLHDQFLTLKEIVNCIEVSLDRSECLSLKL